MKHSNPSTGKRHLVLLLLLLLCSVKTAWADDSGLITRQITVDVPTAGTLSNIIQSDKMYKITNLKITGNLNYDDLAFIRKIAGCYYDSNRHKYDGHLEHLDLGSVENITFNTNEYVYDENGYKHCLYRCIIPLAYLYNLKTVVLPKFQGYFSLTGCRSLTTVEIVGTNCLENISDEAFKDCSSLTTVNIPSTITSIGQYAFQGCSSLKNVSIPINVTSIGQYAFQGCSSLKNVSIPNNVTSIGQYAFSGCSSLEGIWLPSKFNNIAPSAFEGCTNLQYIDCSSPKESIGSRAFAGCSKLTWLNNTIGSNTTMGTSVFEDCKSLEHITLPENMTSLPYSTFKGCTSLSNITLPAGLTSIGNYAFDGCSNLEKIDLPYYLTNLGTRALANCSKLTNLTLPSSIQTIGSDAFAGCCGLTRIDANMAAPVKASQSTFDGVSFSNCNLYVPIGTYQTYWLANGWGSFEHIFDCLTQQKSKMVTVETAGSLRSKISSDEKFKITHLKVSGPLDVNDIQYIREMAGCYDNGVKNAGILQHLDLFNVTYVDKDLSLPLYRQDGQDGTFYITKAGDYNYPHAIFAYLDGLQSVILPKKEAFTGNFMFFYCKNLTSVSAENTEILEFGRSTFNGCSSLYDLKMPSNCQIIEDNAFANCSSLPYCNMARVRTIGKQAFFNCSSMTSINISWGVTAIADFTFYGCTSLTYISLPNTLKTIGDRAFIQCTGLTEIDLPEDVESIAYGAFGLCSGLKKVTLPAKLNSIGDNAFDGCTNLTYLTAKMKTPTTVNENTFNNVPCDKCVLIVPEGSANAYKEAAVWNKFCPITEGMSSGTTVVVDQAGTLSTKISSTDKDNISSLKVIGPINIDDIQFLREMAGCWFEERDKSSNGRMNHLDLDAARLVGSDKSINIYIQGWWNDQTNRLVNTAKIESNGNEFSHLFSQLIHLSSVVMPSYLTTTGRGTFIGSPISSVSMSENVTTIGESCFSECEDLTSINLPASVKNIDAYAFNGCGFTEFVIPDAITTISDNLFANCPNLWKITFPKTITSMGNGIFSHSGIGNFTLPKQITEITNNMFEGCQNLEHIYLHDGLKSIGDYAFQDCNSLGGITLPNSVTKIGKGCFAHCDYLKEGVTLSDAITEIPEEAFADCGYLHEIKLPAELKRIGYRAFCGSPYIGSFGGLKIPSKVTEIAPEAFYKSFQEIEVLELPANLKTVGDYAFAACSAKVIYAYMSEPFALGDDDFYGLPRSECKLYVPKGCAKKYRQAEIWKEFDIEEMDGTGIEGVTNDSTVTEEARYDANGNMLAAPAKGLNIVRYSDGTVKKVMVE